MSDDEDLADKDPPVLVRLDRSCFFSDVDSDEIMGLAIDNHLEPRGVIKNVTVTRSNNPNWVVGDTYCLLGEWCIPVSAIELLAMEADDA